jgi:hypothetical protein
MDAQALEIAVPTERGEPILACRNGCQLVSGVPGGRGCKSCNWYLGCLSVRPPLPSGWSLAARL